jgi:DsbC/DsbD-like thiol-disulfide interchange protein
VKTILLASGASVLVIALGAQQPASVKPVTETPHLSVSASLLSGPGSLAPGARASLVVDVTPKPNIHVYAPGEKDAIPVSLTLTPDAGVKADAPEFPKPEKFFFEPLKLTQLVYSKSFRITQPITIADTPALRERIRAGNTLVLKGTLRYQACDDKVCYVPKNVPLTWTLEVR